jgi:hypothetical protein
MPPFGDICLAQEFCGEKFFDGWVPRAVHGHDPLVGEWDTVVTWLTPRAKQEDPY